MQTSEIVTSRRRILPMALIPLIALSCLTATTDAGATSDQTFPLEKLEYAVDDTNRAGWWRPLAESSPQHGNNTYFAFNVPAEQPNHHEVHIAKQGGGDDWHSACLKLDDGSCAVYQDDIGHNQPSIAVDGDGRIHAFVSMHGNTWRYFRSEEPGKVESMTWASPDLPDNNLGITYPVTTEGGNGDVWVMVRAQVPGNSTGEGRLYRWDNKREEWTRISLFARRQGFAVYPDDLQVDSHGRVHILWEWVGAAAGSNRHAGSYLIYDPDIDRLTAIDGSIVDTPVDPESNEAMLYQPLEEGETYTSGDPALQSAKLALDGEAPRLGGVAYRYRSGGDFHVRYASWTGDKWQREVVASIDPDINGPLPVQTAATVDATHRAPTTRVYFTMQRQTCAREQFSQAVVAERFVSETRPTSLGEWQFRTIGDIHPQIVLTRTTTRTNGDDVVYVSAPNAIDAERGHLYKGEFPRKGDWSDGASYRQVVEELIEATPDDPAARENLALSADVEVSSVLDAWQGKRTVDGSCLDGSRWLSDRGDPEPTITLKFGASVRVDDLVIYNGHLNQSTGYIKAFSVEGRISGGEWSTIAEVAGNNGSPALVKAGDTLVDELRLVFTEPGPSGIARVYEIMAFGDVVD